MTNAFDAKRGLAVAHKRCDQCLLTENRIVSEDRKNEILEDCEQSGKYFLCHKATLRDENIICAGFFDLKINSACNVAENYGLVVRIDPATGEVKKPAPFLNHDNPDK